MTEFFQVVTVDEASRLLQEKWQFQRPTGDVGLLASLGRRLAEDAFAKDDVPGFDRATMDGYAVRAADTFGASEALPAFLRVVGEVPMGASPRVEASAGCAVAVATGAMLPPGADAVVMVEYTQEMGPGEIEVNRPVAPGENTLRRGDDFTCGQLLLPRNHHLRPQDLGLLAAAGFDRVKVFEPVTVGVLSTGNEVVPPEQAPGPGQVRDINSYTLAGLAIQAGAKVKHYGIVGDNLQVLTERIEAALLDSNLVVLSGGSSVGTRDLTIQALERLGRAILFHGVAIKPGKPTLAAAVGSGLVIGLPGHPVSAMVVFEVLVRPLLDGGGGDLRPKVWAKLGRNVSSGLGRDDYVRVSLGVGEEGLVAEPALGQSGLINTMVRADGFVVIPMNREGLAAGEMVEVRLFD